MKKLTSIHHFAFRTQLKYVLPGSDFSDVLMLKPTQLCQTSMDSRSMHFSISAIVQGIAVSEGSQNKLILKQKPLGTFDSEKN